MTLAMAHLIFPTLYAMSKRNPDTFRDHLACIRDHGHRSDDVFRAFTRLIACAVANGTREAEYLEEINRWKPEQVQHFIGAFAALVTEMETKPFEDVLGFYYIEEASSKSGQKWAGEFYTPPEVCKMCAQITLGNEPPAHRPITLLEPCCGAGGMVLAFADALKKQDVSPLDMRATCIDINAVACDMCFFNLTMWGIPATVIHGNALSLEVWHSWRNLFWYYRGGPMEAAIELLKEPVPEHEVHFAIETAQKQSKTGQFILDLEEAS